MVKNSDDKKSISYESVPISIEKDEQKSDKLDGGYGWVILLVAFLNSFILDGCMYSFGILLEEIKIHFQASQNIANLLQSLNTGFSFISGPICSGLASQFGCRVVVMSSSAIYGLMYVLCVFLPSFYYLIFAFGVIGGICFGCAYLTNFIILVDYFDKKLGIANGIIMAGSGLGAFALAPITNYFISNYGWEYTMIFLGSLILQCCILGALLRPVTYYQEKKTQNMDSSKDENKDDKINKKKTSQLITEIFREMTNFKLVKQNRDFLLISLSNFFIFLFYFVPFIYIPIRAKDLGIAHYPWIISIIEQAIFAVLFAISMAGLNCLATNYLVEIVGADNFRNANGILNMFRGVGCIFGSYIAGYVSDITGTVLYPFIIAGSSYVIASILSGVISIKYCCDRTKKSDENSNIETIE